MEDGRKHLSTSRIPVRWGDMDAYGHVNNTVYFRYFEQARVEWVEGMDFRVGPGNPMSTVVISAGCTFLIPVNYPGTVIVKLYAGEPGRSSLMTWYELYVEGDERLYAEGTAKMVWTDTLSGKSTPLPARLRELFD